MHGKLISPFAQGNKTPNPTPGCHLICATHCRTTTQHAVIWVQDLSYIISFRVFNGEHSNQAFIIFSCDGRRQQNVNILIDWLEDSQKQTFETRYLMDKNIGFLKATD
jgi:hypothetical protein